MDVVDVIASQDRPGLIAQCINAAAVGDFDHHVMDMVVFYDAVRLAGGRCVPSEADGYPGIWHEGNMIMTDPGVFGKGGE